MKIKPKIYAQALADLMEKGLNQKGMEKFFKFLEKNGDLNKAKEIVALAEDLFVKKTGRRKVTVETARKMKPKQKELVESITHKGDIISEKINKDLIAGIKIIVNDEQLDLSMQKKLNNIFK